MGTTVAADLDGYVHPTGGGGYFECPMNAPQGARLIKFEMVAHDESDLSLALANIGRCTLLAGPGTPCSGLGGMSSTGTASLPTTARFSVDLNPVVVDRTDNVYFIRLLINSVTGDVKFREVGVYYQLQVSTPAPGTQTFADVPPSFLYWKAIEALAASGITGGCGGGNFCPNQNVTRGEMAAFLARALGLHFPN
jgi:hypothetical protein